MTETFSSSLVLKIYQQSRSNMDDLASASFMDSEDTKETTMESDSVTMSHQDALAYVEKGIAELIQSDPLLQYLPPGVTLEELNSLLALEYGRAMTVKVHRADGETYSVVVEQKATVIDLKKAIQRHIALKLKREGCERFISWHYVWQTYWLYHEGQKLTKNDKPLKDYDIKNNSEITFMKRLKNK